MSDLLNDELTAIYEGEIALADHIKRTVMHDIVAKKFTDYELAGRLGTTRIGVEAMKTRKLWTLRYAISVARKLGYKIGRLEVVLND